MQLSRISGRRLFIQADNNYRQLVIACLPFGNPSDKIPFGNPVFRHGISDMIRCVHTYPDTVYFFQRIIIGILEFPVQLFRQHSCAIENPSGHNPVFLIKFLLCFHIEQKLNHGHIFVSGKHGTKSDIKCDATLTGNHAFRIVPCD